MSDTNKFDRGVLRIDEDECKGCGLCVEACPPKVIRLNDHLNHSGYRTATYTGAGCTGCGICFMACPEPGAITVLRAVSRKLAAAIPPIASQGAAPCASN
ncbi:MAG: 4Fe-4S dicluster-binding protein [Terracidiphilus sp.]|jgi:NAD-dependent dihydropyrimidine dehydrogenase PreA subunit